MALSPAPPIPGSPPPPLPRSVGARLGELARLSGPVILSRSGMFIMSLVDTVMVGRFAARELAYQSIAVSVTIPLFVTSIGLILGTMVLTARALGEGNLPGCGAAWRRGIAYAALLGAIGLAIAMLAEPFLILTGQTADIAQGGGNVARILALGMPPMIVFMASGYFLEGLKRPMPPLVFMVIANIANFALNWMWIYGNLGFEAHGAAGAAWATTTARAAAMVLILVYVWNLKDREALGIRRRAGGGWRAWALQRRIGYSAGTSQAVESSAFAAQIIIAGLLGATQLAAYTIAFQVLALVFMTALGIGSATAVLVGHAWGRRDFAEMARAGWTGLCANSAVMAVFAAGVYMFAGPITRGFATDPALIAVATPLVAFVAFVLIPDGGQGVLAHALRGRGDTWVPVFTHFISFIAILVPLAWYLALPAGRGATGILEAILIASIVSLVLLGWRFDRLARRQKHAKR
jgi:MATE family multidrug resistance protein